jgi:hypothetical protein
MMRNGRLGEAAAVSYARGSVAAGLAGHHMLNRACMGRSLKVRAAFVMRRRS